MEIIRLERDNRSRCQMTTASLFYGGEKTLESLHRSGIDFYGAVDKAADAGRCFVA